MYFIIVAIKLLERDRKYGVEFVEMETNNEGGYSMIAEREKLIKELTKMGFAKSVVINVINCEFQRFETAI